MQTIIDWLFGAAGDAPLGACLVGHPAVTLIQLLADSAIALSYFGILAGLVWFLRHRLELSPAYRTFAWLMGLFLLSSAFTHIVSITTLYTTVIRTCGRDQGNDGVRLHRDSRAAVAAPAEPGEDAVLGAARRRQREAAAGSRGPRSHPVRTGGDPPRAGDPRRGAHARAQPGQGAVRDRAARRQYPCILTGS